MRANYVWSTNTVKILPGRQSLLLNYYTAFIQRSDYEMHQMKFSLPCCQVSLSFKQSLARALLILFLIRFQTSNVHVHLFLANTWKNSSPTHPPSDDQLALDCPQQWSHLITLATISAYPFISLTYSFSAFSTHFTPPLFPSCQSSLVSEDSLQ